MMFLNEYMAIEQLKGYKNLQVQIKMIEKYPIGNGMYLESTNDGDLLQDLHKTLRGIPSYMYLNSHEQKLESTVNSYLVNHPLGTKSQLHTVKNISVLDREDENRLRQLKKKIEKVIKARNGAIDDYESILKRISELQELQDQVDQINYVLNVLEGYKPKYAELLRLRYIEEKTTEEVADQMNISRRTLDRWRPKAIEEYASLMEMTHK